MTKLQEFAGLQVYHEDTIDSHQQTKEMIKFKLSKYSRNWPGIFYGMERNGTIPRSFLGYKKRNIASQVESCDPLSEITSQYKNGGDSVGTNG